MSVRKQVCTKFRTTLLMFFTIESQFDRHVNLWFGAEDNFVKHFTSTVINAGILCERKFWCKRSPIRASIVQKTSPKQAICWF